MKKKVLTILGTRPEIIRLSLIIPLLDKYTNHKIVHTGQNYDYNLDKVFFKNFSLRKPDYFLNAKGNFANQIAVIIKKLHDIILKEKPSRFLVLGDTNSSLGAIVAKRLGVPVFHMEAGNRQYDDIVPEEINRRVIDTSSDVLLPYTSRSAQNLTKEGFDRSKIFITGNPIYEVINKFYKNINKSNIHGLLKIKEKKYFVVTLHRQENVDNDIRLKFICSALNDIYKKYKLKIIWPMHPRTIKNIKKFKIKLNKNIIITKPLDFFNFIKLEINSFCVLTDSGTVQEECAIFKIPNIILRDKTERPETIESGSSIISMKNKADILNSIKFSTDNKLISDEVVGYHDLNVSKKVLNIILSNYEFDK